MGDLGGTLPFMAPEQITNFREAKPPADQYGAAATLYYLCTGKSVLADDTRNDGRQITKSILLADPVPIEHRRADIPPALGRLIHKALAKTTRGSIRRTWRRFGRRSPPSSALDKPTWIIHQPVG